MSLELLRDWLGEGGKPVPSEQASHRAAACVYGQNGNPCQSNIAPNWWDRVKSAIASTIKAQLEMKQGMKLQVQLEDCLGMCSVCGCCLKLKIWTPIEHIKSHTSAEQLKQYPAWCWQRLEMTT